MNDLISRQAALDALGERPMVWTSDDDYALGERNQYDLDRLAVETVPSADAVEVVRCKDCKYFDSGTDEDGKLFFKCLGWFYGGTSEDDFCSHGERKDG